MFSRRSFIAGAAALAVPRAYGSVPSLPTWLPVPIIRGAGLDKVSIDIPSRFALPNGDRLWIDPENPNALREALARDEPLICCRPGRYTAPVALYGRVKSIIGPMGNVVIASDSRSGAIVNEGGTLAIGPGVTLNGVGIVSRPWNGAKPTTILHGCEIISACGNALTSAGGVCFSSNVRARSSQYDSFNYGHDDDGNPNFAIEYNCHASDAGDVPTYGRFLPSGALRDNLNGSSSHNSTIIRYGGLYEGSMGPDIADTWEAYPKGVSVNYGVLTRSSKIGLGYIFAGGDGTPCAYLNNCSSEDVKIDILAEAKANVLCYRSDLPNQRLKTGGKIGFYGG